MRSFCVEALDKSWTVNIVDAVSSEVLKRYGPFDTREKAELVCDGLKQGYKMGTWDASVAFSPKNKG